MSFRQQRINRSQNALDRVRSGGGLRRTAQGGTSRNLAPLSEPADIRIETARAGACRAVYSRSLGDHNYRNHFIGLGGRIWYRFSGSAFHQHDHRSDSRRCRTYGLTQRWTVCHRHAGIYGCHCLSVHFYRWPAAFQHRKLLAACSSWYCISRSCCACAI
jgi:hypothetical protein